MYCLSVIKSASFQTPRAHAAPALTDRDCSYCRSRAGLVLHSAVHRSTVFLSKDSPIFRDTLRKLKRRTQAGRNRLIESFF